MEQTTVRTIDSNEYKQYIHSKTTDILKEMYKICFKKYSLPTAYRTSLLAPLHAARQPHSLETCVKVVLNKVLTTEMFNVLRACTVLPCFTQQIHRNVRTSTAMNCRAKLTDATQTKARIHVNTIKCQRNVPKAHYLAVILTRFFDAADVVNAVALASRGDVR